MGLLNFSYIFLLVALPLGVVFRITPIANVHIYSIDIALLVLFLTTCFLTIKQKKYCFNTGITKSLILFIAICILSLLASFSTLSVTELTVSLLYGMRLLLFANVLYAVQLLPKQKIKPYIWYLSFSGSAFLVLGYFQYFLYPDLRNLFYLGWDEHLHRLFSTFLDPNFAGAFFVLNLVLLLYLYSKKNKSIQNVYLVLGIVLTIPTIFLTYSRGSYIMLIIALSVYFFMCGYKKLILGLFAMFILGIILLPKNLGGEGVNLLRTASIETRVTSLTTAKDIFITHPMFGVGFNAYRYSQTRITNNNIPDNAGAGVQNSFFFVLATTGIIGFVAFINFFIQIFRYFWNKPTKRAFIYSVIVGILVHSLFDNTVFYSFIAVWMFFVVGLFMVDK